MEVNQKVEFNLSKLQKSCEEKLIKLEKVTNEVQEKEKIIHHLRNIPSKQVELSKMIVQSASIQLKLVVAEVNQVIHEEENNHDHLHRLWEQISMQRMIITQTLGASKHYLDHEVQTIEQNQEKMQNLYNCVVERKLMLQEEKRKIQSDLKDDLPHTDRQKGAIDGLKSKLQCIRKKKEELKPQLYMLRL